VISRYVFNYPSNSGLVAWEGALGRNLVARREGGRDGPARPIAYAVWTPVSLHPGRVRPFLRFTNLTNADYQEILGVAMPGRGIVGGLELVLLRGSRMGARRPGGGNRWRFLSAGRLVGPSPGTWSGGHEGTALPQCQHRCEGRIRTTAHCPALPTDQCRRLEGSG